MRTRITPNTDTFHAVESIYLSLSQFAYCPLIRMFYSRQINHKIIKLLERALRIVYKDHFSSFEELLSKYKSVTVHQRNLQILATEMYKILDGYASTFKTKSNFYTTPNAQGFSQDILKQLDVDYRPSLTWPRKFGTFYPKRWNKLLLWMNSRPKIKIWDLENCPWRLCRTYLLQRGFIT